MTHYYSFLTDAISVARKQFQRLIRFIANVTSMPTRDLCFGVNHMTRSTFEKHKIIDVHEAIPKTQDE